MFDINDKETIIKIIKQRSDDEYVIPLYVKIYNKTYSILELDSIKDFNQSSFKVGFGTASSMFMKNSFPKLFVFKIFFVIIYVLLESYLLIFFKLYFF